MTASLLSHLLIDSKPRRPRLDKVCWFKTTCFVFVIVTSEIFRILQAKEMELNLVFIAFAFKCSWHSFHLCPCNSFTESLSNCFLWCFFGTMFWFFFGFWTFSLNSTHFASVPFLTPMLFSCCRFFNSNRPSARSPGCHTDPRAGIPSGWPCWSLHWHVCPFRHFGLCYQTGTGEDSAGV